MSRKGVISIFLLLFFLNILIVNAQTIQKETQALSTVLKIIETRYNISFSYADANIKHKQTTIPDNGLTLREALNVLKDQTSLDFEILDNRFVVIKTDSNEGLENNIQRLDEIVITNYLTTGITKLNDGTVTINPENFGIIPGLIEPDILKTIQSIPGVLSIDETVTNINVRGGTHDQNLLLWEGIKMYQSGHFFGLISAFNPHTTTQVNVSKNGTRAKYGDGISSIVDMRLSNKIDNKFKAGGGLNLINADVFAKIPLTKNTELQISSRRSLTDLVTTPTYNLYKKRIFQDTDLTQANTNVIAKNESFYFYDVTAKFLYDISENDKLRFHFLKVSNKLNFEEQTDLNNTNEILNSKLSQSNSAIGLSYKRDWNPKLSTTTQFYITNYELDATNFDIVNNQRLIQTNEVVDGTIKIDANYKLNDQLKINAGYQFTEVGISNLEDVNNPVFRSFIKDVVQNNSLYAEAAFLSTNAKTNLKLGNRINHFPKFKLILNEPRLTFSQRFLKHFRFELLGEFMSQSTSQVIDLQNDFLGIEKRRWVLSNNNKEVITVNNKKIQPVPILKSKQVSLGIHYNKSKLLISTEAYLKNVDGITARSQGFQNQYQFVNSIGSYQAKGIDVLINKQFSHLFSSWFNYSYSRNDYTFPELNMGDPFPNNVDIRHALALSSSYTYKGLKLALGLNWHSGKPTTLPTLDENINDNSISYQAPNSSNLKDYLRADCSATYKFNISETSRAVIGVSIWNILNQKNIINTYYTLDNNNSITPIETRSLGVTPNVSLRINLN